MLRQASSGCHPILSSSLDVCISRGTFRGHFCTRGVTADRSLAKRKSHASSRAVDAQCTLVTVPGMRATELAVSKAPNAPAPERCSDSTSASSQLQSIGLPAMRRRSLRPWPYRPGGRQVELARNDRRATCAKFDPYERKRGARLVRHRSRHWPSGSFVIVAAGTGRPAINIALA
jgi:hypothetical protein